MPLATYKTWIQAPASRVWDMMLDKIEHPDRYIQGVSKVEILQRFGPLSVERVMFLGERRIHEIITADPATMTVVFKLADDPRQTGFVLNTVFAGEGGCWLDFTLHWTPREGEDGGPDMTPVVTAAVLHTKKLAEQG